MKRAEYQAKPQHFFSNVERILSKSHPLTGRNFQFCLTSTQVGPEPMHGVLFFSVSAAVLPPTALGVCALESDVPWERALLTSSPASSHVQTPAKPSPAVALQIYLAKDKMLLSPPRSNDWQRCLIQGLGSQVLHWAKVVFVCPVPSMSVLGALGETN